jgi:hypothetical protein
MKTIDIIFAVLFGGMALFALGAALFAGATWHFGSAIASGAMAWVLIDEIRSINKKHNGETGKGANR